MKELEKNLQNIDKDNAYSVIRVIKETAYGKTEEVQSQDGRRYIRKYFTAGDFGDNAELKYLAGLSHPLLPQIHDYYELAGMNVLIQEMIYGATLLELIHLDNGMTEEKAIDIALQLCHIISFLHNQKPHPIIHRDIKPDNIIYTVDGTIRLIDFGVARVFKPNSPNDTVYFGTPGYAPPEQFGFKQTDRRTDIYAIGITLIHMLTGNIPELSHLQNLSRLDIAPRLSKILSTCVQFDPAGRYKDVSSLILDLERYKKSIEQRPTDTTAKKHAGFYPRTRTWPNSVKYVMIPVHIFFAIIYIGSFIGAIDNPNNLGKSDMLYKALDNISFILFIISPVYFLTFNIFDIEGKFPVLKKHKIVSKIVIIVISYFSFYLLAMYIQGHASSNFLNSRGYTF